jgi:hypothetical protein
MNYCTITPTRGDRPELLKHCLEQLRRMNGGFHVTNAYLMNDKPRSEKPDIIDRVRKGIEMAKKDGFEFAFVIEDDDHYPENYLTSIDMDFDFFGYEDTVYYNLKNRTYEKYNHPRRSSLFTTGFRISAMDKFNWPSDDTVFLDTRIWDFALRKKMKTVLLKNNPCTGIKHGIGKTGGKGHRLKMKNMDSDYNFLRSRVGDDFEFYKNLTL